MHEDHKDAHFGIYQKFRIERVDGRHGPGEKHEGCEYFVLDVTHDPYAIPALLAYARSCEEEFPKLARDIRYMASCPGDSTRWHENHPMVTGEQP